MAFGIERVFAAVQELKDTLTRLIHDETKDLSRNIATARKQISTELADARSILNDRVTETNRAVDDARNTIAALRHDMSELHAVIQGWKAEVAEARAAAEEARNAHCDALQRQVLGSPETDTEQSPSTEPTEAQPAPEEGAHRNLLLAAAGITFAEIDCHRDTWSFLVEQAACGEHFRLPADVIERNDGTVDAEVSGRTLIAITDALWDAHRRPGTSVRTRALAERAYDRIEAALDDVTSRGKGQRVTRIVIDDRPAASDESEDSQPTLETARSS